MRWLSIGRRVNPVPTMSDLAQSVGVGYIALGIAAYRADVAGEMRIW